MKKTICDKCKFESFDGGQFRTLRLTLSDTRLYSEQKECHEVDWCIPCLEKLVGEVPPTYANPPSKCEALFESLVEEILERVRNEA